MATFVLVPGAYGGAWLWRRVARLLAAAGHEAFPVSLTGMGERVHLAHPDIDLDTFIQDVVNVIEFGELENVILVGHSFGGMVVSGVAERVPDKIEQVVFLDAYVPQDGQSAADLLGPQAAAFAQHIADTQGDGWRIPPQNPPDARLTPMPIKTAFQPVRIGNPVAAALARTFIYCTEDKDEPDPFIAPIILAAERIKADETWRYYELESGHGAMIQAPEKLVHLLLELA